MTPLLRPLLCVATLGAATASAQRFTLTDLGNPTPDASNLTAFINNQETIVLTSTLTGGFDSFDGVFVGQGGDQVHVFRDGTYQRIAPWRPTMPAMRAVAINNANQIAGWSYDYEAINQSNAWVYEVDTATLRDLDDETNDQAWGFTFDINDDGLVLGSNIRDWNGNAWIYDGANVVVLDDIFPQEKLYWDLNNENQLLGSHFDNLGTGDFIYSLDTGTVEELGAADEFDRLNDAGVAAGVSSEEPALAVRSGGTTQLYPLPADTIEVSEINNAGWIVGSFSAAPNHRHAFLFSGSEAVDLNSLVVDASGWTIETATGINDHGQIVGRMRNHAGDLHLYRLDVIDGVTSHYTWENLPIEPQYGTFTLTYDAIPSAVGIDGVTGLSRTPADWYTDLAPIVRFAPSGRIDARNGSGYQALNVLNYQAGVTYHISMTVDLWAKHYSVAVAPAGGTPVVIATNFAFRPEQSRANELKHLNLVASGGYLTVRNAVVQDSGSGAMFSAGTWENAALPAHGNAFTVSYKVTPSRANLDAVTGLAAGPADWFDDLAPIVRFAPSGFIDARNGGAYQASGIVPYSAGVTYEVELTVDLSAHSYSATVTPEGGTEQTVASNYAFRSEQSSVSELNTFALFSSGGGGTEVTDVEVE